MKKLTEWLVKPFINEAPREKALVKIRYMDQRLTEVKSTLSNKEDQLKNFLIGHYGLKAWDDLIAEEGRIRKARRQAVYEREERNRMIRDYTIIGIASLIGCVAVGCVAWIISGSF